MDDTVRVLDHGFVRLDAAMADDLSVVNAARVSFARRKEAMDESDVGLVRFLLRERHGTPLEHNSFRFHIRCPIFVAREWFRHRIGCLAGDTVVTFVDVNGSASAALSKTIDELWRMWTVGERNGRALRPAHARAAERLAAAGVSESSIARGLGIGRRGVRSHLCGTNEYRDARWRLRKMRLRVLDEGTNEFVHSHICDIVDKGVQPVYRLALDDGKTLTLTENHRVLTTDGWATMREAVGLVGEGQTATMTRHCLLHTNGVPAHRDPEWYRIRLAVTDRHKEAIRRARSGPSSNFWRGGVTSARAAIAAWTTQQAPSVHHQYDYTCQLTAHPVAAAAVEYVGRRQTYDLCVEGPWHNFVANGIVVHNSFNEFSMRYAKATDDFYVPDAADVRTQVGKPGAYSFEPVDAELAARTREELQAVYETAYATYERLVDAGVARELARSVMPVGAYTEFYWTVNARALMNFVSLRNHPNAQLEIRRYAEAVEEFLRRKMPVTYEAFVANDRTAP